MLGTERVIENITRTLEVLQSLWWLPTLLQAFARTVGSSVVARVNTAALWSQICWPVSTNTLSVHPCFTFPHTREVDGNRIITCRGCEFCLRLENCSYTSTQGNNLRKWIDQTNRMNISCLLSPYWVHSYVVYKLVSRWDYHTDLIPNQWLIDWISIGGDPFWWGLWRIIQVQIFSSESNLKYQIMIN